MKNKMKSEELNKINGGETALTAKKGGSVIIPTGTKIYSIKKQGGFIYSLLGTTIESGSGVVTLPDSAISNVHIQLSSPIEYCEYKTNKVKTTPEIIAVKGSDI